VHIQKEIMSLQIKIKQTLENFENVPSNEILEILNQIQNQFQSQITQDYLKGKLKTISDTPDENEKKKLCKNLKPYFDWYLQGL
jgi:SOS response regulatory protein OraA/RecX